MSAAIVVDDGTNPLVTGSVDLGSGFLTTLFTLSNFNDSAVLGWRWTLVDKPIGSAASLATPTAATTTFTPDVSGGYLVRLETFLDVPATVADDADEQVIRIRFAAPFDWGVPAAGETTQLDTNRGWATPREEAIRDVHAFMNGGLPQLTGVVGGLMDGADPEEVFGGFVLDGSNFPDVALKLRIVGRIVVAGAGTGELRLYDMGAPGTPIVPVLRSTAVIENGVAGDVVVRDQALTPAAAPGVGADEVHTARRIYEMRAVMVGAAGGDSLRIHNGGITLEG